MTCDGKKGWGKGRAERGNKRCERKWKRGKETHLLYRLILPHQLISRLQPESLNTLLIITPTQNRHPSKLFIAPPCKVELSTFRKVVASDVHAVPFAVEFEEDVAAAEDEEVRVFGDYGVDETGFFEVAELRVGFVGGDDVLCERRGSVIEEGGARTGKGEGYEPGRLPA
jgi:hypothetical protein